MRYWINLLLALCLSMPISAFTLVIDPGHGGDDPGAVGKITNEKTLNLNAAKQLGAKIHEAYPDVKIIYTRQKDVFIPLRERANIANKNNADLFISIHTNSAQSRNAYGAETFVLGTDRADDNLEVAMRENAVIKMEDDYQSSYQGFDPNSVDSYIMFELMQSDYMDQSLRFATLVQRQFVDSLHRADRGVRQAAFWVLLKTACPSVLVEMGFISNRDEEKWLASDYGMEQITNSIFRAFAQFYKPGEAVPTIPSDTIRPIASVTNTQVKESNITFKVQIFSTRQELKKNDPTFKGLKNCTYVKDGKWYKYMYGQCRTYKEAKQLQTQLKSKFPDCVVVAFEGNEQIPVKVAIDKQ